MCFQVPVALAAGLRAGGALLGALQQRNAARYSAALAENAAIGAQQKAAARAALAREQGRDEADSALARFGKAGVDPGASGSAAAVIGGTAADAERAAQAELHSGRLAADAARGRAELARARGRRALVAGMVRAGSTLLTGLSRAGGSAGLLR